jgi:hypothetical protein
MRERQRRFGVDLDAVSAHEVFPVRSSLYRVTESGEHAVDQGEADTKCSPRKVPRQLAPRGTWSGARLLCLHSAPRRNRTYNLVIKSHLLCQLS